jgi:hypothetical protein
MPGLGYAIDAPEAIAAREKPTNWPMALLVALTLPVPGDWDADLGPVLDQDNVGACVAFSSTSVRSYQEKIDEGGWRFDSPAAFLAYDWLKNGHGSYPGDGYNGEGSWPLACWTLAKAEGLPGADGKARRIAAYYQLTGSPGDQAWIDTQIQVLLQFGPVTVSSAWPANWWVANSANGFLPYPSGTAGAHQYVRKGFWLKGPVGPLSSGMSPTGRYWRHRNSWGTYGKTDKFGRTGEFLLPFEADWQYPNLKINEVWKTVDIKDAPAPPPPPPLQGDAMRAYDRQPRIFDLPLGTQFYRTDAVTPLVKLSKAAVGLYSGHAIDSASYEVVITTGGVMQAAIVRRAACKNVRNWA